MMCKFSERKFCKDFTKRLIKQGFEYVGDISHPYYLYQTSSYTIEVGVMDVNGTHLVKFNERHGNCVFFLGWVDSLAIANKLLKLIKK